MDGTPRQTAVIIEDDDTIRQLVGVVLEHLGLDVIAVANGTDGVAAVKAHSPVVVTLDVNMPGIDGFETAKRIRAFSSTYIVMLTARDEEIDALQGLGSGADDYVLKPFRPRELRARIEAMLRRPREVTPPPGTATRVGSPQSAVAAAPGRGVPSAAPLGGVPSAAPGHGVPSAAPVGGVPSAAPPGGVPSAAPAVAPTTNGTPISAHAGAPSPAAADARPVVTEYANWVHHNGLKLDPDSRLVELDGEAVELTRSEFDLLSALLESRRRVRSKSDLALLLRGESYVTSHYVSEADRRGVEVHIANLRKKLGDNPAQPRIVETVRGVGYRLTAPQD